jgi:hypothetical protein
MPTMLKHNPCSACGHRHHFSLAIGRLTAGHRYEYVCPETGKKASLCPDTDGEAVSFPTQGAVALVAEEEVVRTG